MFHRASPPALLALVLCLARPAAADTTPDALAVALADYKKVEKSHDPEVCTQRRLLVERIAAAGGASAARPLLAIAASDSEILCRVAALEGIAHAGGPDDVEKVIKAVKVEAKRYAWVPLWVARSLGGATNAAVGPWLASKVAAEGTSDVAVAMVRALGALRCAEAVPALLKAVEKHGNAERNVRFVFEILRALGRIGGPEASAKVLEAAASPDRRLRLAAADTLLSTDGGAAHIEAMTKLLADPCPVVRRAVATAAAAVKSKPLRGALIERLTDTSRIASEAAYLALVAIDGVDRGMRAEAWLPNGEAYASPRPAHDDKSKLPTDHALFLLDMSISMGWPVPPATPRLPLAREVLSGFLRRLDEKTLFNVREFASESSTWKKGKGKGPADVPATAANVQDAIAWVQGLTTHMYTHFDEILEAIEDHPDVDTIWLVTDGRIQFDADDVNEKFIVRLETANLFRRIPIHVSFVWWGPTPKPQWEADGEIMLPILKAMVRETGGTYEEFRKPR